LGERRSENDMLPTNMWKKETQRGEKRSKKGGKG